MEATLLTSAFTYTGKVIRVKKDDIKLIDKETKEDLKFQQDIIRLKLKFNSNKSHVVDKDHKFYLSRMDTLKASNELYNVQEDLKTVLNTSADVTKYDYKKIKVEDFINYNCEKIYQDVFINQNEKRNKTGNLVFFDIVYFTFLLVFGKMKKVVI